MQKEHSHTCCCIVCIPSDALTIEQIQIMDDVREIEMKQIPDKRLRDRRFTFERMPESCPIVADILRDCLGNLGALAELRRILDIDIHNRVTSKFRAALNDCVQELHVEIEKNISLEKENDRLHKCLEITNDQLKNLNKTIVESTEKITLLNEQLQRLKHGQA